MDVTVLYKDQKGWWRHSYRTIAVWLFVCIIGIFFRSFKRRFVGNFSNALGGKTLIFPDRSYGTIEHPEKLSVWFHEVVHLIDQQRNGILFTLSYIFPPVFVTFRSEWEMRGYLANVYVRSHLKQMREEDFQRYASHFKSSMYFWMDIFDSHKAIQKFRYIRYASLTCRFHPFYQRSSFPFR